MKACNNRCSSIPLSQLIPKGKQRIIISTTPGLEVVATTKLPTQIQRERETCKALICVNDASNISHFLFVLNSEIDKYSCAESLQHSLWRIGITTIICLCLPRTRLIKIPSNIGKLHLFFFFFGDWNVMIAVAFQRKKRIILICVCFV